MLTKRKTEKSLNASAARFAIVCARYNERYTDAMLGAALDTLNVGGVTSRGGKADAVSPDTAYNGAPSGRALPRGVCVVRVPGTFEIPVVAAQLARSGKYDAVIALGCIIQGKTDHARLIGESVANALQNIAVETGVPCIFSVVTAANEKQARERCLRKKHNRGIEAARTAIEMAAVRKKLL